MAVNDIWSNMIGFVKGFFFLGTDGPKMAKDSGLANKATLRANDGSSAAIFDVNELDTKTIRLTSLDGSYYIDVTFPNGAGANRTFILPKNAPNNGDTLVYNSATGELQFTTPGGYTSNVDYDLVFNSSTPVDLVLLPDGGFVDTITVIVATAFNGLPKSKLQIGVSGTTDKFVPESDVDLHKVGMYVLDVKQYQDTAATMIATYTAAGATVGAAKIIISHTKPA